MAKLRAETVALLGSFLTKEGEAASGISPGHLIEFTSTGKLQKQSTAKAACRVAFALEDDLHGNGTEVDYKAKDWVRYGVFNRGREVQAKLPAGAAALIKGDALEANGGGTVRKHTDGVVLGFAFEAIDNSVGTVEQSIYIEVA